MRLNSFKREVVWAVKAIIIIMVIILAVMYGGEYVIEQNKKTQALEKLAEVKNKKIQELSEKRELDNQELVAEMTAEMLSKLSREEWGKVEKGDGKLRYANDPQKKRYTECRRIGGARNINCDSWTEYQWKIPTAQMFYKKVYGEDLSEKEMLVKLLDDNFVHEFTARVIIENKGAVWHWTTAKNSKDYYEVVVATIRKLNK